jgi:hypothetical protein
MHRDLLLLKEEGGWSSVQLVERYAHLPPASMGPEVEAWRAACPVFTQDLPSVLTQRANRLKKQGRMVGDNGIEPLASPVSGENPTHGDTSKSAEFSHS